LFALRAWNRLRIAYVCHYFVPEPAAPAARVHEMSRAWVAAGAQVTVLTTFPNFPTGVVPQRYRGRLVAEETLDGIRVLRTPVYALPNRGVSPRALNHLSFMLSALLVGLPRLETVDVVIASSPTLFSAVSGWLIAAIKRVPFVLEVRDLWPEAFVDVGVMRDGLLVRLLQRLAWFLYRRAARVVVVTEGFAEHLAAGGLPRVRLAVIPNGADTGLFDPEKDGQATRTALGIDPAAFVVGYVGSHGLSQGLSAVLDAASRLPGVLFLLVGDGADRARLVAERGRRGLGNVRMLPSVAREDVPGLYAAADVCLVPLRDVPIFRTFVPSKLFELLAAGRPIVGAVRGEARSILERSGAALLADPEDGAGIAAAIDRLRADESLRLALGRSGRAFAVREFDRDALAQRYLALLAAVARA